MTATEGFVLFFSGMAFFAILGILFAKRLINGAFSLGLLLMAIAGIYASLSLQAAFFSQLVLYIGGIMVLIGFALQLYPESKELPAWHKVRTSAGKAFILFLMMLACMYLAPWQELKGWEFNLKSIAVPSEKQSLRAVGQELLLRFPLEFEWLGVLMLAGLLVAGWFLKDHYHIKEQK